MYFLCMSVQEVKDGLAMLSQPQQDEVIAYVLLQREMEDPSFQADLARRMDDKDPSHWLTLEQFERELDKKERS